jgi:thymidylate synthase (FAD)
MAHVVVPEAEAILDKEYKVLNHGFVRLVDYMGGDERIVQAARVSYGKGTKTKRKDSGLINYLLRNRHTSPFEQVIFTFHVKLPIFVARQWIRHRTARLNEISGRYSVMADEFYLPDPEDIRVQSSDNKQGRGEELAPEQQQKVLQMLKTEQAAIYENYNAFIQDDVARELARVNLPLSLYTQWYWQIDLHNLFHFLRLRLDAHAQLEIRKYGEVMAEMVKAVAPMSYQAFEEHILNSKRIASSTLERIKKALQAGKIDPEEASEILAQLEK